MWNGTETFFLKEKIIIEMNAPKPVLITRTGLLCTLGSYAVADEILLTELIVGKEAEDIRSEMKKREGLVTHYATVWSDPPEKLDPPVYFTPLATDEVWRFTTSETSWRHLAGRARYALVRDGVLICEIVTVMA